jgi:protein NirF
VIQARQFHRRGDFSDDGKLVAVSNYEPGGVKVFDADTLALVADMPMQTARPWASSMSPVSRFAVGRHGTRARSGFWAISSIRAEPCDQAKLDRISAGKNPFDAVLTDDGAYLSGGTFRRKGRDGFRPVGRESDPVKKFLTDYGKTGEDMPVYKMPHLQGWALSTEGQYALPAVGPASRSCGSTATASQTGGHAPRSMASRSLHHRPALTSPYVWVNFATPLNDTVQVVDSRTHQVVATR